MIHSKNLSIRLRARERTLEDMISLKLVHLIEEHASELADAIVVKLHSNPRTRSLQNIPAPDLRNRIQDTLYDFHGWLLTRGDHSVQERYRELGKHHATHGVALPDLCWAFVVIKEHLWNFVERQTFHTNSVEIHAELELMRLLEMFFDSAICYVAEGHEQMRGEMRAPTRPLGESQVPLIPGRPKWLRSPRNADAAGG